MSGKKEIIIHESDYDEYSVLILTDNEDFEYEDEGELGRTDADALAEEIQKKYPEYKIIYP